MAIDDQLDIYKRRSAQAEQLIEETLQQLLPVSAVANGHSTDGRSLFAIDPIRLERTQVVEISSTVAANLSLPGAQITSQGTVLALVGTESDGTGGVIPVPVSMQSPRAYTSGSDFILENAHFKLVISNGRITSLIDLLLNRELIMAGRSARDAGLMLYDDLPLAYDAWDTEIYHLDCCEVLEFEEVAVKENGPLRASLLATARFGKSIASITVSQG